MPKSDFIRINRYASLYDNFVYFNQARGSKYQIILNELKATFVDEKAKEMYLTPLIELNQQLRTGFFELFMEEPDEHVLLMKEMQQLFILPNKEEVVGDYSELQENDAGQEEDERDNPEVMQNLSIGLSNNPEVEPFRVSLDSISNDTDSKSKPEALSLEATTKLGLFSTQDHKNDLKEDSDLALSKDQLQEIPMLFLNKEAVISFYQENVEKYKKQHTHFISVLIERANNNAVQITKDEIISLPKHSR